MRELICGLLDRSNRVSSRPSAALPGVVVVQLQGQVDFPQSIGP